ncbi:PEP-utilizing enzyme, partial [Streptomyces lonarensis]
GGGPLAGLGSSRGTVRGTARVVLDPHGPVPAGDDVILVARETDPGWLFLMLRARGIVVERGTMLSHTAITGRKFGIPTIVALPGATSRIPDGCRVEMDGSTGTVTLLDDDGEVRA